MAYFTSTFWEWYIFILVVLSFAFCFALIIWMQRVKKPTKVESHGHVWDGDLEELNNPLPRCADTRPSLHRFKAPLITRTSPATKSQRQNC